MARRTYAEPLFYGGNLFPDVPAGAGVYVARGGAKLTGAAVGATPIKATTLNPHASLLWRATDIPQYWLDGEKLVGRILGAAIGVGVTNQAQACGADDLTVTLTRGQIDSSGAVVGSYGDVWQYLWPIPQTAATPSRKPAGLVGDAAPWVWGLTPDANLDVDGRTGLLATYSDTAVNVTKTAFWLTVQVAIAMWVDDGFVRT